MRQNFYKALDVKSNSIKVRERNILINKNIILNLKKREEKPLGNPQGASVQWSIPKLLDLPRQKDYLPAEHTRSVL